MTTWDGRPQWSIVGLLVVFCLQLVNGIRLIHDPTATGAVKTLCILVVVCFLVGISRARELVGGRSLGLVHNLTGLARTAVGRRRGS